MNKYDKKIINAYIDGDDIEDYTIEELENDSKFMKMVIAKTHDKKMFELCSDELKKDPNFIKFIIMFFNNEKEFICNIIDEFIKTADDIQTFTELVILMSKYTKDNTINKYEKYIALIYLEFKTQILLAKEEYKGTEVEDDIGMGFVFIYDCYDHSPITLNYFAHNFLIDMFIDYDNNLEELVHNEFDEYKELEEYGINKYLLNLINRYDCSLASYITTNKVLLKPLYQLLRQIKEEWDLYPEKKEKKQYELMIDRVLDYTNDLKNSTLCELELLYYTGTCLGIVDKIRKYDTLMDDELYEAFLSDMDIRINLTRFNVYDIKYINDIENIMIDTLELKVNKSNPNNLRQRITKKVLIKNNKQDN